MHRLLVETALLSQAAPALPAGALKHLRVVRPKTGERVELFDGRGAWRVFAYGPDGLAAVADEPVRTLPPPSVTLTLFACVTKGSRWDWTIEKATELGVTRIVPVISDRTIVRIPAAERAAKRERWLRIAEDAARQSDAKWLPEIREAVDFKDALPLVRETTCFVGALTNPPSPHLLVSLQTFKTVVNPVPGSWPGRPRPGVMDESPLLNQGEDALATGSAIASIQPLDNSSLSVFVGPEGDFTPEELAELLRIGVPTSFGPTVLRAETAAIFALSVLSAVRG